MFLIQNKETQEIHSFRTAYQLTVFMLGRDTKDYQAFVLQPVAWPEDKSFTNVEAALIEAEKNLDKE